MSRRDIEVLVAELAPRADVPSLVRRLPSPASTTPVAATAPITNRAPQGHDERARGVSGFKRPSGTLPRPTPGPVIQVLAPARYRVQFTIGAETQEKLRRLQALLCRRARHAVRHSYFEISGHVHTRFLSPYTWSMRATAGQNFRSCSQGAGKAACARV